MPIKENLANVRARIAQAATSVGRNPEEIKLVVVTKTVGVELVEQAIQAGVAAEKAVELLKIVSKFANIQVEGLMTMAPLADDPETARPFFKKLRLLSQEISKLNLPNVRMKYLSMGMTDDFTVAVQEGSNMVRIGRAIFKGVL